jgi:hypothetical protein
VQGLACRRTSIILLASGTHKHSRTVARIHLQIFYYIVLAVFGVIKGLAQLNLGNTTTFQEVVAAFPDMPTRWWGVGMSAKGEENLRE